LAARFIPAASSARWLDRKKNDGDQPALRAGAADAALVAYEQLRRYALAGSPRDAVQQELTARLDEADRLRHRQVERAQYEADLARCRYLQVDPANRLVADSLEADWNARLRALADAQEDYQRRRAADRLVVDEPQRQRILALATDFPVVWRDPQTPPRERKRMLALLIDDVTVIKQRQITAAVRFL
jgi:hypothetical protein